MRTTPRFFNKLFVVMPQRVGPKMGNDKESSETDQHEINGPRPRRQKTCHKYSEALKLIQIGNTCNSGPREGIRRYLRGSSFLGSEILGIRQDSHCF